MVDLFTMSLFKKSKRIVETESIIDGDNPYLKGDPMCTKPKHSKPNHSLLSFADELNQADDNEIFKVKKSALSRKMKRRLDKERKKNKRKTISSSDDDEHNKTVVNDEIAIKRRNLPLALNEKEAQAAIEQQISSDEPPTSTLNTYTKRYESVKIIIDSGEIPSAATIEAARKQRRQVRKICEIIPVPDDSSSFESKSKLVREAQFEVLQGCNSEDSGKVMEQERAIQHILKGEVREPRVVDKEIYYQQYLGAANSAKGIMNECEVFDSNRFNYGATNLPDCLENIRGGLNKLKEDYRKHSSDIDARLKEIDVLNKDSTLLKDNLSKLAERLRFYQDLRGFINDLVECLNEKIVLVNLFEQRVEAFFGHRNTEYITRRRQDVIDQLQELFPFSQRGTRVEKDEFQVRRAANREIRRIRRQRARELNGITSHIQGMSSDEEIDEANAVSARTELKTIKKDAKNIFEDTIKEFSTVKGILRRFETWKRFDVDVYTEAHVILWLPKLLGPLIRLKLLFWEPFVQGKRDLEKFTWGKRILLYCLDKTETMQSLKKDPDSLLLSRVFEQILLPKITRLTSLCWDPLSCSQTVSMIGLVTKLINDYPTIQSSTFLNSLILAIVYKIKDAVENDIFIPIYAEQKLLEPKLNSFFMRQCTVAVKLLGNSIHLRGIISDNTLFEIALDSLLNRHLLLALQICQPLQAANLCHMIASVLPQVWLRECARPPQLTSFFNMAKSVAEELDFDKPVERDALNRMRSVLKLTTN